MNRLLFALIIMGSLSVFAKDKFIEDESSEYLKLNLTQHTIANENEGGRDDYRLTKGGKPITTITRDQYVNGGLIGTLLGLGLGHAVQGRYSKTGWVFTLTEPIFYLLMVGNVESGTDATLNTVLFLAWRIYGIIDVWTLPSSHKIAERKNYHIAPMYFVSKENPDKPSYGLSLGLRW